MGVEVHWGANRIFSAEAFALIGDAESNSNLPFQSAKEFSGGCVGCSVIAFYFIDSLNS